MRADLVWIVKSGVTEKDDPCKVCMRLRIRATKWICNLLLPTVNVAYLVDTWRVFSEGLLKACEINGSKECFLRQL
jgi:hypothetical protein